MPSESSGRQPKPPTDPAAETNMFDLEKAIKTWKREGFISYRFYENRFPWTAR